MCGMKRQCSSGRIATPDPFTGVQIATYGNVSSLVAFLHRAAVRGELLLARDEHCGAAWDCTLDNDGMEGHGTQNVLDLFEAGM